MNTNTSANGVVAQTASRSRYIIGILLFISVVINYLDRSNLSIAMPAIAGELKLDLSQQGQILAAFSWTYAICQIPGGWLVDRVAPRILFPVLIVLWSIATIGLGFSYSVMTFVLLRFLVGALEAPSYPINNRVVTSWFPERERATAIGFYTSGQFVGLAFLTPVLALIQSQMGWHWVFVTTGGIGIIWGLIWYALYRQPRDFSLANNAEIEHIREGGGLVDMSFKPTKGEKDANGFGQFLKDLGRLLSSRKLLGVFFGQFALTSTLWFFLTWFPSYLVARNPDLSFVKTGVMASVPFIAAFVGVLCSGVLSDFMVRKGASLGIARKVPIVTGLLLSTLIIGANFVTDKYLVIAFMTIACFGNGLASITWSLVSALAPARLLGLTGGVFNLFGNMSGVIVAYVVGYLAKEYGFGAGLTYIASVTLLGALSYIVLVGKVERLPDTSAPV